MFVSRRDVQIDFLCTQTSCSVINKGVRISRAAKVEWRFSGSFWSPPQFMDLHTFLHQGQKEPNWLGSWVC